MTRGLLKSTTMLALAASLAMPMAAQSQEAKADCAQTPDAKACLDKDPKAKGKEAGETAGEKKGKVAAAAGASAETPAAEADLKAGIEAEAEADGALEAPEAQAGTGAPTEGAPAEKAPAAAAQAEAAPEKAETKTEQQAEAPAPKAQAEAKSAEEAPAPDAAQAQASEPGAAPAAEAEAKSAETKGSDELKKALEAEQAAQGDATPEPKAASGAEVTADTASEPASAEGSDELKKALEAGQSADADATATPKAAAETDTTTEADAQPAGTEGSDDLKKALEAEQAEQAAQGTATEKPDAPEMEATAADAAPKAPTAEADAEQQAAAPDAEAKPRTAEAEPEAPSAEQQAEAVAREEQQSQTAAAAAAASSEEAPEDAELVEESLTEADVRASDEDFATDLRTQAENEQQAETSAKAKKDDDDEDGLSNFEKAALVGLGTFALSQILDDGAQVVQNTGDRVVVEQDGQYRVLRNDDVLLRQPGSDVKTYRYNDGSTRTVVAYDDGTSVETIKTADGRVLRRARILPDGQQVVLFDDTQSAQQVVVSELPQARTQRLNFRDLQGEDLAAALASQEADGVDRAFSLNQIRNIDRVRHLVPEISVDTVTFQTNSAAIRPGEAEELAALGNAMKRMIEENPSEVFLIEGHTDATGPASYNLALSDRRAESVALALTEYFDVPAANMVLQGYGESDLAVQSSGDERENRRAAVRRITPLLQGS
ncbi:OmpA family protein [Salipiger pacificus]|nr:OmpA family protein [Alloyangia pacifica]MCA0946035.1 OmpA family protein [Alloyangia pacifica]